MPLTGQAKKDYQRGYMKEYMRKSRMLRPTNAVKTPVKTPVKTSDLSVSPFNPISKEQSLRVGMTKRQSQKETVFSQLKKKYDIRRARCH